LIHGVGIGSALAGQMVAKVERIKAPFLGLEIWVRHGWKVLPMLYSFLFCFIPSSLYNLPLSSMIHSSILNMCSAKVHPH